MVTYNKAVIRTDENGDSFLDLEIRVAAEGQVFIVRNTFPATSNLKIDLSHGEKLDDNGKAD